MFRKSTKAQQFNINYKRPSVNWAVACLIGRCVRSVSCIHCVTFVALRTLRALRWMEIPLTSTRTCVMIGRRT